MITLLAFLLWTTILYCSEYRYDYLTVKPNFGVNILLPRYKLISIYIHYFNIEYYFKINEMFREYLEMQFSSSLYWPNIYLNYNDNDLSVSLTDKDVGEKET